MLRRPVRHGGCHGCLALRFDSGAYRIYRRPDAAKV
jgi:hypothetical protein